MNKKMPLISIITVVYNGEKYLEDTIKSVVNQSCKNIEYIIIDGASSDRTIDIIKKYENKIDKWISEPDNGIYDAMNKGLKVATGEWIVFMNVGDRFFDLDVLKKVFQDSDYNDDIVCIYGDLMTQNGLKKHFKYDGIQNLLTKTIGHQAIFIRKDKHSLFNTKYKVSADYELLIKLANKKFQFLYLTQTIAFYDTEKAYMSANQRNKYAQTRVMEKLDIAIKHIPFPYKIISIIYYSLQKIKYKTQSLFL